MNGRFFNRKFVFGALLVWGGSSARADSLDPTYYMVNFGLTSNSSTLSSITTVHGDLLTSKDNSGGQFGLPLSAVISLTTAVLSSANSSIETPLYNFTTSSPGTFTFHYPNDDKTDNGKDDTFVNVINRASPDGKVYSPNYSPSESWYTTTGPSATINLTSAGIFLHPGTEFQIGGANAPETGFSGNSSFPINFNFFTFNDDANGNVTLTVDEDGNFTTIYSLGQHAGAFEVFAVPEPTRFVALLGMGCIGGLALFARRTRSRVRLSSLAPARA